jgi:hypothetical protein
MKMGKNGKYNKEEIAETTHKTMQTTLVMDITIAVMGVNVTLNHALNLFHGLFQGLFMAEKNRWSDS